MHFMNNDQIDELVTIAKLNGVLWQQLLDRELEIEKALGDTKYQGREIDDPNVVLDLPANPPLYTLVSELIAHRYGETHDFVTASVAMGLRRRLREHLNLPT